MNRVINACVVPEGASYDPASDSWSPMSQVNQPSARNNQSAVWTGSEMIIWGGIPNGDCCWLGDGARYNPMTDTWQPVSLVNAPFPRAYHTAVWYRKPNDYLGWWPSTSK